MKNLMVLVVLALAIPAAAIADSTPAAQAAAYSPRLWPA